MKRFLLASTMLTLAGAAIAQTTQTGAIGGLNYAKLTSPDGCSTASPCQIVTYLHYLGGEGATADDVQKYFNNTQFWSANPHTIVLAPMINGSSDTNNWGGVQGGVSPNMQAAVDLVKQTEATNPTNPNSVVVTGGSMGGIGTQSAMIEYGPQGTTGQHVFTAGLAYDGATYNVDSATQKSALCGVPLTLVHGTADTTVSPSPDQQLAQTLSGCSGFNANWVQDATHGTWNNPDWKGYGASTLINQTMTQARSGSGTSSSVTQSAPSAVQPATSATATTSTANTQLRTSQNAQVSTAQSSQAIAPGQTFTDANGNVWAITPSGSITENGQYTPGGGGTSALTIVAGVVYGEDSSGKGWFALSGGQYWTSAPAPSGITTTQAQGVGTTTTNTPSQGTSTQTVAIPPPSCGNVTGGQFGILPLKQGGTGQIIDSAGNVFAPRGINVMYGNGNPSAATLKSTFPGINFLRLAIYNYNSPQELAPYVDDLTSNGIVVELEDHNNNAGGAGGGQGVIFSGQTLTDESSWYASVASAFKSNPYVWFGTNNEPSTKSASGQTDPAALSQWQRATYDAIRATGNQSIIFLETACWTEGGKPVCNQGYDSSAYSGMSNVAWDNHVYGWLTNFNTDQATNDQFVSDNVTALASIKSAGNAIMPVVIGEYGNSTTGQAIDPNGTQVVNAVNKSVTNGGAAGSSAWAWGSGGPGDGLTNGGSGLSSYGQQVASAMTQATPTVSVCQGSASQVAQGTTPAGKASVALTQKAPAAGEQTDTAGTAPVLTAADPTADPTYIQAASGAATSAAQATSAAIAAGQARMKGN